MTGHGRPIVVTRKDINEIQLAKAAIRVGVEILLQEAGATYDEIDEFIVAGAFGTYLDIASSSPHGDVPASAAERSRRWATRPAPAPDRCWSRAPAGRRLPGWPKK